MILPLFYTYFTHLFCIAENSIETFIDFSKHMVDLGINSGLPTLENSLGKSGGNKIVFGRVYDTGVCHIPVPVVENKLYHRINT